MAPQSEPQTWTLPDGQTFTDFTAYKQELLRQARAVIDRVARSVPSPALQPAQPATAAVELAPEPVPPADSSPAAATSSASPELATSTPIDEPAAGPRSWEWCGVTYASYPEFLRGRDRWVFDFLRRLGVDPGPLPEIPDDATPETFDAEPIWPVSQAIYDALAKKLRKLRSGNLASPKNEPKYLIPGLLAAGKPGGIFGGFKTLKTSLAADLLISIASGTPFLGKFPVTQPGKVVLLSGELEVDELRSLALRICNERGLSLETLDNFVVSTDIPMLDNPIDLMALELLIAEEKPVCLVIDSAHLAIGKTNCRNPFAMGGVLKPLRKLCESTGCAILLVHNCKRTSKTGPPARLDDVAWSGFAEFASQWLMLSRRRPFDPATDRHELWLSAGSRNGRHNLWALDVDEPSPAEGAELCGWKTSVRPAAWGQAQVEKQLLDAAEDRRLSRWTQTRARHRRRVLEYLAPFELGRTANSIRDALGFNGNRMRQLLDDLVAQGLLATKEITHCKRKDILYRRVVQNDLSLSAVQSGDVTPVDEKTFEIRSGHFSDGKTPQNPGQRPTGATCVKLSDPEIAELIRAEFGPEAAAEAVWPEPEPKSGPDTQNDGKNAGNSPSGDAPQQC